jgi:chromosome segregation ATPase
MFSKLEVSALFRISLESKLSETVESLRKEKIKYNESISVRKLLESKLESAEARLTDVERSSHEELEACKLQISTLQVQKDDLETSLKSIKEQMEQLQMDKLCADQLVAVTKFGNHDLSEEVTRLVHQVYFCTLRLLL